MKTLTIKVYEFGELNDKAKEKAREWYREGALDYEWWESTYEDAERVGLKINEFGLDRDRHATGDWKNDCTPEICARLICKEHGKDCETFKTATAYLADIGRTEVDGEREAFAEEFLRSLLEDYSIIPQHEYEYLMSDASVDEMIIANGYTFTAEGKRMG